jgi:DNA-binding transcriptional LysR family regulator
MRATRSVSPTEAGERLLVTLVLHFDGIQAELARLSDFRRQAGCRACCRTAG